MRKIIFTLMLVVASGLWMTSTAICMAPIPDAMYQPLATVTGILQHRPMPCEEGEDCPPCLTAALVTEEQTYYLTTDNKEMEKQLDSLMYYLMSVNCICPQTISGIPFTRGGNDYIKVLKIESDNAQLPTTVYGVWNVMSGGDNILHSISIYRDSDYKYGHSGSAYANDGEFGASIYRQDGNRLYFIRACVVLDVADPNYKDECSLSFSTTYRLENDVLILDSFAYEQGIFIRGLTLSRERNSLNAAKVLLSGKWYIENERDSIIYNFSPAHKDWGLVWGVRGDDRFENFSRYSLTAQEGDRWLMTVISDQDTLTYTILQLSDNEMVWEYMEETENGGVARRQVLKHAPLVEGNSDTEYIPLYIMTDDDSGSSTVDPVDPNQVVAMLKGDELTIKESSGETITYQLSNTSASSAPGLRKMPQSQTFQGEISLTLTEEGNYSLILTNPGWNYRIVGRFEYPKKHQGIDPVAGDEEKSGIKKVLRNGQIVIERNGKRYNLLGGEL